MTGGANGAALGVVGALLGVATGGIGGAIIGSFLKSGNAAIFSGCVIGGATSGSFGMAVHAPPGEMLKYAIFGALIGGMVGAIGGLVGIQSELSHPETFAGFMSAINDTGMGLGSGAIYGLIDGFFWLMSKL